MGPPDPMPLLREWIEEARARGLPQPAAAAFVTVGSDGRPSARTVNLKRLEDDALVFTSALWTRKAREARENPSVAVLFHWPSLGRQAHIMGTGELADRGLAEELFAERDLLHQLQSVISRQGEPVAELEPLRDRLSHLARCWSGRRASSFGVKPRTESTSDGCSPVRARAGS